MVWVCVEPPWNRSEARRIHRADSPPERMGKDGAFTQTPGESHEESCGLVDEKGLTWRY